MEKYRMVAQDIAQKIESGVYPGGSQLPLESELCEAYQVSRITIKKATDQLVQLGLITKRRGSGTFVKELSNLSMENTVVGEQIQFTGFSRQFTGRKISTQVNKFAVIPATSEIASKLYIQEDDLVYDICRTRFLDGEPYVVEYTYMPVELIPGINKHVLEGSIYSHILNTLQLKPQSAHRILRAILPAEEEKQYFQTNTPMAMLEIEQVAYLSDGRVFEFSRSHCRGDKYTFRFVSVW